MKKFVFAAVLVLIVATVAACAPATPPAAGTPGPAVTAAPTIPPAPSIKNPDTFVEATYGEPESLDPAWAYDTSSENIIQNVYEYLVTYKRDAVDQFVGVLASDWKTSADGKTWTFNIRKGVKFSNGDPMSASDVAYSYVRGFIQSRDSGPQWIMLQPFFGAQVTSGFLDKGVKPGDKTGDDVVNTQFNGDFVAACTAAQKMIVADNTAGTVTMTLPQPWGALLPSIANAWGAVVDQKWAVAQGDWDGTCANAEKFNNPDADKSALFDKMIGTGPYMLNKWDKGNSITLDANPNYWLTQPLWDGGPSGPAKIAHIVYKNVPEWGTRYASLTTGDTDYATVDSNFYAQVDPLVKEDCDPSGNGKCTPVNANGFLRRYSNMTQTSQDTVFFNQKINVTGGNTFVGSGKLDGNGITPDFYANVHIRKAFVACFDYDTFIKQVRNGFGIVPNGPVIPGELGYDPNGPKQQFSLDTCKAEFDAAAKDPGFENLTTQGFYAGFVYNTGNANRQAAGQILAASLAKVNPKFHLSVIDEPWPVFLKDYTAGRLGAFMLGWLEDFHDPQDWVAPYLGSGGSYSGTQSFDPALQKQMDTLIAQALATNDSAARAKIYSQLNAMSIDNALDIFVDTPVSRRYEQLWVKGWFFNPIYQNNNVSDYYVLSKSQ
ncbi:MAG: ABC transporter substrate-binding protein [Chloroflexi bacterium]|nr:ABC transporter substrate-binding protein [Chloroflexota bacterium]